MTRRRWRRIGLVSLVTLAALAAGFWVRPEAAGLGRVRVLLGGDDRYSTAIEAGDTLAEVSGVLLTEARRCDANGEDLRACDAMAQAAAFAQVLAVRVLDCTAPGRFEVRQALRGHLDAIAAMGPSGPAPAPPQLPTC